MIAKVAVVTLVLGGILLVSVFELHRQEVAKAFDHQIFGLWLSNLNESRRRLSTSANLVPPISWFLGAVGVILNALGFLKIRRWVGEEGILHAFGVLCLIGAVGAGVFPSIAFEFWIATAAGLSCFVTAALLYSGFIHDPLALKTVQYWTFGGCVGVVVAVLVLEMSNVPSYVWILIGLGSVLLIVGMIFDVNGVGEIAAFLNALGFCSLAAGLLFLVFPTNPKKKLLLPLGYATGSCFFATFLGMIFMVSPDIAETFLFRVGNESDSSFWLAQLFHEMVEIGFSSLLIMQKGLPRVVVVLILTAFACDFWAFYQIGHIISILKRPSTKSSYLSSTWKARGVTVHSALGAEVVSGKVTGGDTRDGVSLDDTESDAETGALMGHPVTRAEAEKAAVLNKRAIPFFVADGLSDILQVTAALVLLRARGGGGGQGEESTSTAEEVVAVVQAILSFVELSMTGFELGVDILKFLVRTSVGTAPDRLPDLPRYTWTLRALQGLRYTALVVVYVLTQRGVLDHRGVGFYLSLALCGLVGFGTLVDVLCTYKAFVGPVVWERGGVDRLTDGKFTKENPNALSLVEMDSPDRCVFDRLEDLVTGRPAPLTLASHPGFGVGLKTKTPNSGGVGSWPFIYAALVPAAEAVVVRLEPGPSEFKKFIRLDGLQEEEEAGPKPVAGLSHFHLKAEPLAVFSGHASGDVHESSFGQMGTRWLLNTDNTLTNSKSFERVLGLAAAFPPPSKTIELQSLSSPQKDNAASR